MAQRNALSVLQQVYAVALQGEDSMEALSAWYREFGTAKEQLKQALMAVGVPALCVLPLTVGKLSLVHLACTKLAFREMVQQLIASRAAMEALLCVERCDGLRTCQGPFAVLLTAA